MKNVFFAAFFGAACCLSGCRQEAATPATGEHYAFAEEMFRKGAMTADYGRVMELTNKVTELLTKAKTAPVSYTHLTLPTT